MISNLKPFAIFHEHADWFRPLFTELERRGIPYQRIDARKHLYDPSARHERDEYALLFNRMSPSAYLRGGGNSIFYTLSYLEHLERQGLRVINGSQSYGYEISKARQLHMLDRLGIAHPRTRVIDHSMLAPLAAEGLRFPVVVKADVGGSGAGIVRYDTLSELQRAANQNEIDLGVNGTALVQEYVPAQDGRITRVETLGGRFLYAIHVYTDGQSFNLCPADICRTSDGMKLARAACPADAPQNGLTVEAYLPPPEVIEAVERIAQAGSIDVGGVEYMIDDRDGRPVYYDVNALSNFVADAIRVVGFDPHARLVDYLIEEARR